MDKLSNKNIHSDILQLYAYIVASVLCGYVLYFLYCISFVMDDGCV